MTDELSDEEVSYTYDILNQLTDVEYSDGREEHYTYDKCGNILSFDNGVTLHTYTYGNVQWKDLLTAVDGINFTYDDSGLLEQYYNGRGYSFKWSEGRKLTQANAWTYSYNDDGIRIRKERIDGLYTEYLIAGGVVIGEKSYNKSGKLSKQLMYIFDENGSVCGYSSSIDGETWTDYYFVRNLQGDVLKVFRKSDGAVVAEYTYDAWGNVLSATGECAKENPFRYRGYYYDDETKFYYVSSRYYDPAVGRWINADAAIGQIGNVQGNNMFAYCFNNPVNMSDPTGNWPKLSTIFTVVAVAAVAVAAVAITVATCGATAPAFAVAGGGIVGGISVGATATTATVVTGAMSVAGISTVAAVTSAVAEKAVEKTTKRNNSVYVLKDDAGTVQYVGRTNNVDKRRAAHSVNPARAGLEMEVIASGLNLPEARALEQAGMTYYHTINTANKMNNQINSVSPKYWGAFKELALGTLNYGWNQMSNEILYWTGN